MWLFFVCSARAADLSGRFVRWAAKIGTGKPGFGRGTDTPWH